MNKTGFLLVFVLSYAFTCNSQINGKLMQYPDVSETHITFIYGDDVWVALKADGIAHRLSSPEGMESYPRFSPDGKTIAYTANYHGNSDVYIINIGGGIPKRLTYHGGFDRVLGWSRDGKSVLFASSRESGRQRYNQFYTVPAKGGIPTKLIIPYGEFASFSPNGNKLAYTDKSRANRNWKRYRGGTAPDITVFDLKTFATENITNNSANDEFPMWVENKIYYMSDNGPNKRNNIWAYDFETKTNTQLTRFKEYDITYPESSNSEIIFEAGGKLYLYNISKDTTSEINIKIVSDQKELIPVQKEVSSYIQNASISPDGNRVIVQARGELFNLPATEGFITNLSSTSGAAERKPSWSPNGKYVACWSDITGEYQLTLYDIDNPGDPKTISAFKSGFNYTIYWSPDSEKIAFVDQAMNIKYINITTGKVNQIDKAMYLFEGGLRSFNISWSPDSEWLVYSRSIGNRVTRALFAFNLTQNKISQLTTGYYSDIYPVFSTDGKYLFFNTNRTFNPQYSAIDNTFIYPNATTIAVATLNKNEESLIGIKNDVVEIDTANDPEKDSKDKDEDAKDSKENVKSIVIDVEDFENRVEILDIEAGNFGALHALEDKLIFLRRPNTGAENDSKASLNFYDFKEREVKSIISNIINYQVSANGKKILVNQDSKLAVLDIKSEQKINKTVPTNKMLMNIVPKEEWRQIFNDVWRFERDYFYDPNMHGVDWNAMKSHYGQLIDQANSRNDVNLIIGDLIAELNASHTYNGGGDLTQSKQINVGYLGADFTVENGYYRITKIISGAPWDTEVRSPLSKPGLNIKEGDYILAINGTKIDINKPISVALQALGNSVVQLTINSSPSTTNSRNVVIKTLNSESRLRHLAWIENNRQRVDKETNGRVGYIYVRSTGRDGQNELIRQFYAQMNKEGLIIDERFNSGGQIPDRFIELLDRDPLAFFAVRDGKDWGWPPAGNFGSKVMLINGFSGSGGDAFPDYFRKRGLGPLIGTRTWGGVIGISGAPNLIDNGGITMPTFRMYDPKGVWFKEGHGVDPDIEVIEDFGNLAKGNDIQLEAGIKEILRLINSPNNFKNPSRPKYEKR